MTTFVLFSLDSPLNERILKDRNCSNSPLSSITEFDKITTHIVSHFLVISAIICEEKYAEILVKQEEFKKGDYLEASNYTGGLELSF